MTKPSREGGIKEEPLGGGGATRRRREHEQRENTVGVLSGDEFGGAGDRAGLHEPTDFGI